MARPHGTKYIETPEKMWELFEEYRTEVKENPKVKKVKGNKDFIISEEQLERPLTMDGFEVWAYKKGFTISNYFENKHDSYKDYYSICNIIKKEIRADQIEGGMLNQYHHSITQRLNGLVEKSENKTEHSGTINANFGNPIQPPHQTTDNT